MSSTTGLKKMSGETKISELSSQIQERFPLSRSGFNRFFEWYHKTYFKTNSPKPVLHAMVFIGAVGYAIEYPHIKHEIEENRKRAAEI